MSRREQHFASSPRTDSTDPAPSEPPHQARPRPAGHAAATGLRLLFYGTLAGLAYLMLQDVSRETVGALGLMLILVLLLMRVPVAVAMMSGSALGIWALAGSDVLTLTFSSMPFQNVAGWSLSVVPMFIFMGVMLWRSGASEKIYTAARHWIGWLPGGLAVGTNLAGSGLATVSGSTIGVTYALGRVGVPEMLRAGYDRRYASATILMAGTGGQLIPPSILLVVYAGIASVPVGPQLLAGLLPGILLGLTYGILLVALAVVLPSLVGRRRAPGGGQREDSAGIHSSWSERWRSAAEVWPIPALAIGLLTGLYTGVFTPTEAGAFGAVGAFGINCWYQQGSRILGTTREALGDTVRTTGAIFLLIIAAMVMSRFVTLSGLASWTASTITDLDLDRYQLLFTLLVLYLVLGMFMDSMTMMLITVPILLPALAAYDISALWFGVFVVLLGELAVITPPVGVLTFVLHKLVQDPAVNLGQRITLADVFVGVLWFIPATLAILALLIFFPELAEFIPGAAAQ